MVQYLSIHSQYFDEGAGFISCFKFEIGGARLFVKLPGWWFSVPSEAEGSAKLNPWIRQLGLGCHCDLEQGAPAALVVPFAVNTKEKVVHLYTYEGVCVQFKKYIKLTWGPRPCNSTSTKPVLSQKKGTLCPKTNAQNNTHPKGRRLRPYSSAEHPEGKSLF